MSASVSFRTAAALAGVLAVLACGGAGAEPETAPRPQAAEAAAERASAAESAERTDTVDRAGTRDLAELEALYRARLDSARMRHTEADVHFMQGMIVHHGQALVMARLAPDRDASPALRRLAARIETSQEDEIALMQRWLRDRDRPAPELEIEGTRLTVLGTEAFRPDAPHGMHDMHGMLTAEELSELADARGAEFDRLFLGYMIRHHRGAVTMVRELFATDGAARDPEMFRLASDIHVDQLTEIARMERMLEEMSASDGNR